MHGAWLSSHGVERINPKLFLEAGFVEIMRCGGRGKSCPIASTRRRMDGWRTAILCQIIIGRREVIMKGCLQRNLFMVE